MKNILLVTSSPRGEDSYSTKVARTLVERMRAEFPDARVVVRDLAQSPPPLLDPSSVVAIQATDDDGLTPEQRTLRAISDRYIAELFETDAVVIASGMINFGVPTALKAWIDLVARAGITFRYTGTGPEGLLMGKKAYLVLATGGVYSSGPVQAMDHQAPYLQATLGFLGITDIETIRVEGVAFGADQAVDHARQEIRELALT